MRNAEITGSAVNTANSTRLGSRNSQAARSSRRAMRLRLALGTALPPVRSHSRGNLRCSSCTLQTEAPACAGMTRWSTLATGHDHLFLEAENAGGVAVEDLVLLVGGQAHLVERCLPARHVALETAMIGVGAVEQLARRNFLADVAALDNVVVHHVA